MGAGYHGGFGATQGARGIASGDASFMRNLDQFLRNIRKRKDVDPGGKFDLIAHGTASTLEVEHNGQKIQIDSRTAARLIQQLPGYHGQDIRLLSCRTGASTAGFAQNLANRLNVNVYAPSDTLWAYPNGKHFIAATDSRGLPDMKQLGKFIKFKPGGNRK